MTPEQVEQLRTALITAVDAHLAKGGTLAKGTFGRGTCLCPVACLTGDLIQSTSNYETVLSNKVGFHISFHEMFELTRGFDRRLENGSPLNRLGNELRLRYHASVVNEDT